jgi:Flp pilus assembly protein TadG
MNRRIISCLLRLHRDRSGVVAILAGVLIVALVSFSAIVIDLGFLFYAQRAIQSSADAAALAGAQNLNVGAGGTAISTAISYSGVSGDDNAKANLTITMASGYPQLKCFTSTGVSCTGPDSANGIVVVEQATVPLYFARIFGVSSWQISATSTAGGRGGATQELDVMIVLDTTQSMGTNLDSSCGSGMYRINCAEGGIQVLLSGLWPCVQSLASCGTVTNGNVAAPVDEVGLMAFPGLTNASQAQYDYDCATSPNPATASYAASPVYQIIALSSDFRTSVAATTLNTSSDMVKAAGAGGSGCTQGIQAVGGFGTYYADAITAAQAALAGASRPHAQNVIILLSDGGANAQSSNMPSGKATNQCHEAITAAATAAAAGTWVYSVAYGSSTTASGGTCTTDTPAISSCSTMQQIASDPTKFFADPSGGTPACTSPDNPSITDLNSVFQQIGIEATAPRLLPNNTT